MDTVAGSGFSGSFVVGLQDTDAAGVMFFARLFQRAHEVYEAFMRSIGFGLAEMIAGEDLRLPLVHAEADFKRALRHGAEVTVELSVARIGTSSFDVKYRFLDDRGRLLASAATTHAAVGKDLRGTPLSAALVTALARFRGD